MSPRRAEVLHGLPASHAAAVEARRTIEKRLRRVMARTERVTSTVERDSMMAEPPIAVSVAPADLAQAAAVSNVARALDAPEIIEYWKSAPYLLNTGTMQSISEVHDRHIGVVAKCSARMRPRNAITVWSPPLLCE